MDVENVLTEITNGLWQRSDHWTIKKIENTRKAKNERKDSQIKMIENTGKDKKNIEQIENSRKAWK